jgi:hypothetical protein
MRELQKAGDMMPPTRYSPMAMTKAVTVLFEKKLFTRPLRLFCEFRSIHVENPLYTIA